MRRALRRVAADPDVDDVVQRTAERALQSTRTFTDQAHFTAWCVVVARNLSVDMWRRTRREIARDVPDVQADIDVETLVMVQLVREAIDAGATTAISEFFFDNEVYFRYLDRVRAAGINVPIVPGLIPIHNFKQVAGFARKSGASVPDWLGHRFEGLDDDQETRHLVAAAVAAEQVLGLVDQGITEFHFYTLNRADLVYAICHLLGLRPAKAFSEAKAAS